VCQRQLQITAPGYSASGGAELLDALDLALN
jgi:hypothetical protein